MDQKLILVSTYLVITLGCYFLFIWMYIRGCVIPKELLDLKVYLKKTKQYNVYEEELNKLNVNKTSLRRCIFLAPKFSKPLDRVYNKFLYTRNIYYFEYLESELEEEEEEEKNEEGDKA